MLIALGFEFEEGQFCGTYFRGRYVTPLLGAPFFAIHFRHSLRAAYRILREAREAAG